MRMENGEVVRVLKIYGKTGNGGPWQSTCLACPRPCLPSLVPQNTKLKKNKRKDVSLVYYYR